MAKPKSMKSVAATQDFDFIHGAFELSKVHVPYFATTLTLQEAASDLRLTSEIFGTEDINWSLTELFQREIDWVRVHKKIVPYLRTTETPQFFNSITIALLPYDPVRGRILDKFNENIAWVAPILTDKEAYSKTIEVGPIAFGFWGDWSKPGEDGFRIGRMKWNKNEVVGVAIDGQHRLAAIKEIAKGGMPSQSLIESRVPVIFLLFEPMVGYLNTKEKPTVEILRELFIDLNKHAQIVKRGRQILLDDRDPHAMCTRALIADRLNNDVDLLSSEAPKLPLSLVDWHSDQAKFDSGPYVSTVLGLDAFVVKMLATRPIADWMDFPGIEAQINKLETRLKISLSSAEERLENIAKFDQGVFTYSDLDLKEIHEAFSNIWVSPIVRLLSQLDPYAELIALRSDDESFTIRFQEWYRLYESKNKEGKAGGNSTDAYNQFLSRAKGDEKSPMTEADFLQKLSNINGAKQGNLAYNVVFQRAYIEGFLDYSDTSDSDIEELLSGDEPDVSDFSDIQLDETDDLVYDENSDVLEVRLPEQFDEGKIDCDDIGDFGSDEISVLEERWAAARDQYESRAEEYLLALNAVLSNSDFLNIDCAFQLIRKGRSDNFWEGSLRRPDGAVDFTQAASNRAKDIFFLIGLISIFFRDKEIEVEYSFRDFWELCVDGQALKVYKRAGKAIKRLGGETSVGGRILKARGVDYDEESAVREVSNRLEFVWNSLLVQ